MASPSSTYDVIATGDGLAGLVAAALCARHGLRVLYAPGDARVERIEQGGIALPRMPLPFAITQSPAFRRVAAALNVVQTLKRRTTVPRPAFQLVLPDARLDVGPDGDLFARELERELPGDKARIEELLALGAEASRVLDTVLGQDVSLPPEGFWEKRELKYSEAKLPLPDTGPIAGAEPGTLPWAVLALPGALTLDADPRTMSPVAAARAFERWRSQAARLEGGHELLRQLFIDKLRTHHAGEVQKGGASQVVTRLRRVHGVVLAGRSELVGARHVVASQSPAEVEKLFDRPPRRLTQVAAGVRPTAYRVALHLVVAASGVPEGIAPVCFVVRDPVRELMGSNAYAVWVGDPDEQARVIVTVTANLAAPAAGEALQPAIDALVAELTEAAADVMPFLREHLVAQRSPHVVNEGEESPAAAPDPLWSSELPRIMGVSGAPYDAGVKHLILAGTHTLPGLGLEGELAAGWCAARHIFATSKRKDYLKDEVLASGSGSN